MQLTIAEKIIIYRHRNHLSQTTLADLVHMSTSTLARIEAGSRSVTLEELSSFATVFRVQLSDFILNDASDTPDNPVS